ncbi:hypothetical protein RYH80_09505 [Halobaculum sp. MBLA0147]|uniref:hypothetical protein n=1 Tax=Halobaculum sp. MBLA0147 TaxID=3079934 RepID=UPI003525841E
MTPIGAAGLYELFFLAASAAVVLLSLAAHVVGRQVGHARALGGTLALVGGFTLVGAVGGLGRGATLVAVALGCGFLYVPAGVGLAVGHLVSGRSLEAVARVFPGAWMAALVVALLSQAAGAQLGTVLAGTPGLFGLDWYVGFLAYLVGVGVLAGLAAVPLVTSSAEGIGFFEGLGT